MANEPDNSTVPPTLTGQSFGRALEYFAVSDLGRAAEACRSALGVDPDHPDANLLLGAIMIRAGQNEEALAHLESACRRLPFNQELTKLRTVVAGELSRERIRAGIALQQQGDQAAAGNSFREAMRIDPDNAEAILRVGIVAARDGELELALDLFDRALLLAPNSAHAHNNRANVLKELRRHEEALHSYDQALAIDPDNAEAHTNRGMTLSALGCLDEAISCHNRAIQIRPDYAEAYFNRGNAFQALKRLDEALESYRQAVALQPGFADALINAGNLLCSRNRLPEALFCYEGAITSAPGHANAHNGLGNVLEKLNRLVEALASYDRATVLKPDFAEAHFNRGMTLNRLKQYRAAVESFETAFALEPGLPYLAGELLHTRMKICDWRDFSRQCSSLARQILDRKKATVPFPLVALTADASIQRLAAEIYVSDRHVMQNVPGFSTGQTIGGRIRIGYFSADFFTHATLYLMAELFELHDKQRFDILGFSFGSRRNDAMRARVEAAFGQLIDVEGMSDEDVARLSRDMNIDIAVDLKGYTQHSRTGVFAHRAAPVQISFLGYPGTMGAGFIDYIIADNTLIPETSRRHYSEKIVYMPDSYQVNDRRRKIADHEYTRTGLGLPETGFVFCCFCNSYKITPDCFAGWMRLLQRVDGSVLWLIDDNPDATANLRTEATRCQIEPSRLVFAKRLPLAEHLARHRAADLFVDTYPYNGHTTTSDALWAGLPVLTIMGESFASRVAASLLTAAGLPGLVTTTQASYEAKAIELATRTDRLQAIKHTLAGNRLTTSLFDSERYTRNLESAYVRIQERHRAGLRPEHISLDFPAS
jgi:predicted O-linked N-acetylglucosamine transferase (SPINDLY family)